MLVIVISICAAFSFGVSARKKGYDSPRFWIYPLAVGSGLFLLGFLANFAVRKIVINEDSVFVRIYPYLVSGLSVGVLCITLSRAWKQIGALPQKR
jgi:hypothetical protein